MRTMNHFVLQLVFAFSPLLVSGNSRRNEIRILVFKGATIFENHNFSNTEPTSTKLSLRESLSNLSSF